ncbi:cryptochrome/photolyase family protein [Actibacterium sp. XHP0104]|uniref:cryptochrome/photolyase family protein n=1 Tax=Actibacterium sp. XHP0104 TaxID=2984335 RepID=UPI0021E7D8A1|nr:deoxyribodipyrimidine photo-lyase [Actibacterium sp. XHP0104]MCV2880952.1 DNA photolyase family protein [Actibacterium sp. XHP0104]
MSDTTPIILWLRRDLRLSDHPALTAACRTGRPVIPVFVHDDQVQSLPAAPKWRLGLALDHFARVLADKGSHLILRRGPAVEVLRDLIAETGAGAVYWLRAYDADAIARDTDVKSALMDRGVEPRSFAGNLLFEPWTVQTGQGGYYKVYTPYWNAVRGRDVDVPLIAPDVIPAPQNWPRSDDLSDWQMGAAMDRGAAVVAPYVVVGERAAQGRLGAFISHRIETYKLQRDMLAEPATSGLSENLTYGEISPRTIWHAGQRARAEGAAGAEHFLKELTWREFAWHLMYHCPDLGAENWRAGWDAFPWNADADRPEVIAWKQGRTGVAVVDAAMRQMYVTGTMHNRARMIVASYLTKHLLTDWRVGLRWFADCLIDWDPAANAMGWQWVAGCGPDAAPYFRVFNPDTQSAKFDPDGAYRDHWLGQGAAARSYYDAIPRAWALSPDDAPPQPLIGLKQGRDRALEAYQGLKP